MTDERLDTIRKQIEDDRRRGRLRSVAEYTDSFPGDETLVVRAYSEVEEEAAPSIAVSSIGPYRLLKELGRGGQGLVYLAEDTRLRRNVALKILTGLGAGSEDSLRRFRREAELASKLQHPGICGVLDAGIADGTPYMAMQYVDGITLAEKIASARAAGSTEELSFAIQFSEIEEASDAELASAESESSPTTSVAKRDVIEIVEIFEKAARALHEAHEIGIVHRDLKPGNVMLTSRGDPVILDFGLARADEMGLETLTQSGDVFGTPAYMSPEQVSGSAQRLDRRTDVYSLGATLYECLTLRRPFEAPTREALYQAILTREPEPADRVNPRVPADLRIVVQTSLDKDRDRRYQTALDLADELRRVRLHEPIVARSAGPWLRLLRWAQRNPGIAVTSTALFLAITAGLVISLVLLADNRTLLEDTRRSEKNTRAALATARSERNAKNDALRRSTALLQAATALQVCDEDPALAAALAVESARAHRGPEAATALLRAWSSLYERRTFLGHTDIVNDACFSPDGRQVATASDDGTCRVWDLSSGNELLRISLGDDFQGDYSCALSGTMILASERSGTIRVWDSGTGDLVFSTEDAGDSLRDTAFLPDGNSLLSCHEDGRVRRWDLVSGDLLSTIQLPGVSPRKVQVSADGSAALAYAHEGALCVWKIEDEQVTQLAAAGNHGKVRMSGDGRFIACSRRGLVIWDLGQSPPSSQRLRVARVGEFDFMTNEGDLVISVDGVLKVWNHASRRFTTTIGRHRGYINSLRTRGAMVLTSSNDDSARVWDTASRIRRASFDYPSAPSRLTFSADGKTVILEEQGIFEFPSMNCVMAADEGWYTAAVQGDRVASVHRGKPVRVRRSSPSDTVVTLDDSTGVGFCQQLYFINEGRELLGRSPEGVTTVWDTNTGKNRLTLPDRLHLYGFTLSPSRRYLAATLVGDIPAWRLYDMRSGRVLFTKDSRRLSRAEFIEERGVAICSDYVTTSIIDMKTGKARSAGEELEIEMASYSRHLDALMIRDWDGHVLIRSIRDFSLLETLDVPNCDTVECSPDGKLALFCGASTILYDLEAGAPVLDFDTAELTDDLERRAIFSPCGRYIIKPIAGRRTVLVPIDLLPTVERELPRKLTWSELGRWGGLDESLKARLEDILDESASEADLERTLNRMDGVGETLHDALIAELRTSLGR